MDFLRRIRSKSTLKWLYVGLGVKRWLVLLMLGVTTLGLGIGYLLVTLYREVPVPGFFYYLTLQFIDRPIRGVLFGGLGVGLIILSILKLSESLISGFVEADTNVVEVLYRKRARSKGPKIVAIGGGTGLSTLLRGLKEYTDYITAIVTVADDGGSSGRLRRDLGVLPPGDFRQCIAALADSEPLMTSLFQYRFGAGSGLDGHSFGNLFIVAMAGVTGDFERALLESSRVLAVRGQILPSTLKNVTLCAETRGNEPESDDLARVAGESEITHRGRPIERVYLDPEHVPAYPGAVRAILDADLIVAGPGSLYTSVLPNLLVDDVKRALEAAQAPKLYVCNIATQPGETNDFSVQDHYDALVQHVGSGIFTHVLANNNFSVHFPEQSASKMVRIRPEGALHFELVQADLIDEGMPWRHDSNKLAQTIIQWNKENNKSLARNT